MRRTLARSVGVLARRYRSAGCVAFLVAIALAWCAPALAHGTLFGSYDTALRAGLGASLVSSVHNPLSGDTARQDAVWAQLNWLAVHHGTLPLWNPYNELGIPELANFQSAPAALPSLVSYLVPLSSAYTVAVLVKLLIAGTGCFFAARVLGTSRVAALLAGVVGELAGPSAAWVGWPQAGVAAWTGWVLGFVLLICRRPRWRYVVGLAVAVAFAIAGGFPEVLAILAIAAGAVLLARLGVGRMLHGERRSGVAGPSLRRRLGGVTGGVGLGVLLAAPVWLPGLAVLRASVTVNRPSPFFLPAGELALFWDPTYWGLPTASSTWFGPINYYETAAFVGPVVCCCVAVALLRRWRRPEVLALALAGTLVLLLALGVPPLRELATSAPLLRSIAFGRGLLVVCALLGILAAVGFDELRGGRPGWAGWGTFALAAALTIDLISTTAGGGLSGAERHLRLEGLWLDCGELAVFGAFLCWSELRARARATSALLRARRVGAAPLVPRGGVTLVAVAVTLVVAGASVNTWSSRYLPRNAAVDAYAKRVGGALVALGGGHVPSQPPQLGLVPELNAAYRVRELAGYDAMTSRALLDTWTDLAPAPDLARWELAGSVTDFAPDVTTVAQARALGVSYVLEPARPALRLVGNARSLLTGALARAGNRSVDLVTGTLDELEWYVEQGSLIRAFPSRLPGFVGRYLAAEASLSPGAAQAPSPLGTPAAQTVSALLDRRPALEPELEALVTSAPVPGLVPVATLGREELYRVPGPAGASFVTPAAGAVEASLRYTADATATITLRAARPSWVTVAVDDEPGWSATVGGHAAATRGRSGGEIQVRVPAGKHVLTLSYWPEHLSLALGLALGALLVLAAGSVLASRRGRRAREPARSATGTTSAEPPAPSRLLDVGSRLS
ncbi:MAG TPA: hypothetical protein VMU75_15945 [Acidimicrobiales bacterium]|nr:hypothetical protein [Acidimicrobiales bacterium]